MPTGPAPHRQLGHPLPMIAVSACEENPPARVRRKAGQPGGPLHWMLLISPQSMGGGEADLACATTVLHGYELRWRIARFFHALKQGTRIEDRHLDQADDLRKCFAFDAITAFRVWDLTHLVRTRGVLKARAPPAEAQAMTIERFVVLTGGLAGFHPAKRQPLPGTEKLWQGIRTLTESVFAIRTWETIRTQGKDTESSL